MKFLLLLFSLQYLSSRLSFLAKDPLSPSEDVYPYASTTIELIPQKHNGFYSYYGIIFLGRYRNGSISQPFKVLFDTGSCDFWVPDESCATQACEFKLKYQHKTDSMHDYGMAEFSIPYKDGTVEGQLARETLFLTPLLSLPDQTVGFVTKASFPLMFRSEFDGILGLAFPNRLSREQNIAPVFDSLMMKGILQRPLFSIFVDDNGGKLIFGSWDDDLKERKNDPFVWVPLAEKNYWTFFIVDMYLISKDQGFPKVEKGEEKMCPKGCKGVIDTGSFFIYGPGILINPIITDLERQDCQEIEKLPDLIIQIAAFSSNTQKKRLVELRFKPSDYLIELNEECVLVLKEDKEEMGFTFGWSFLRAYYTVFDRGNQRLGKSRIFQVKTKHLKPFSKKN